MPSQLFFPNNPGLLIWYFRTHFLEEPRPIVLSCPTSCNNKRIAQVGLPLHVLPQLNAEVPETKEEHIVIICTHIKHRQRRDDASCISMWIHLQYQFPLQDQVNHAIDKAAEHPQRGSDFD